MTGLRAVPLAVSLLAITALVGPVSAADATHRACLNKDAQRAAVASGKAIPLARIIKASQSRHKAEVVRARLCQSQLGQNGLVYVLTLLPRNGKVTSATVDAATGNLVGGG